MFEKEAKEYVYNYVISKHMETVDETWRKGAEFGYNKANEWHYVKDGDLPKNENRVWLYFGVDDYNDGQFIRGRFWCGSCGWFDVEDVIAWKEIVLPELKESE